MSPWCQGQGTQLQAGDLWAPAAGSKCLRTWQGGRGGLWPLAVLEGNVCPASREESSGDTALERAQEQLLNREK